MGEKNDIKSSLTKAAAALTEIEQAEDWVGLKAGLRRGDPEAQAVETGLRAFSKRVESLLAGLSEGDFRTITPPGSIITDVTAGSALDLTKLSYSYAELKEILTLRDITMRPSDKAKEVWREEKYKRERWRLKVFTSAGEDRFIPDHILDFYRELYEMRLQTLPAYGKDFTLDPEKIVFKGSIEKLLLAFQQGTVDDVIFTAYPEKVPQSDTQEKVATWLFLQIARQVSISGISQHILNDMCLDTIYDNLRQSKVMFTGSYKPHIRQPHISLHEQIQRIGQLLHMTELGFLFFALNYFSKGAPKEVGIKASKGLRTRNLLTFENGYFNCMIDLSITDKMPENNLFIIG